MGVRPREVDTSFCTETEILEESTILQSNSANGDNNNPINGSSQVNRVNFTLEPPPNNRDVSDCSDDDEYDDYEVGEDSNRRRGVTGCIRSRPCSVCLYLVLVLLLLSSFVSVLVVGILVAAPYHHASKYIPTRCTPIQLSFDRQLRKCSCGKGCSSKYPCLRIEVKYQGPQGVIESTMAEDESTLGRQVSLLIALMLASFFSHTILLCHKDSLLG